MKSRKNHCRKVLYCDTNEISIFYEYIPYVWTHNRPPESIIKFWLGAIIMIMPCEDAHVRNDVIAQKS